MKADTPPDYDPAPTQPDSSVGYKRPPAAHRFKKGQSGNPHGRPKRQEKPAPPPHRPLDDLFLAEAYRPIEIRENGKVETVPIIQAIIRGLGVQAAKGNPRAQRTYLELLQAVEQRRRDDKAAAFAIIRAYKKTCQEECAACDRAGKPRPELVPHPDDIVIDHRAGTVKFNGPVDDHEKGKWNAALARKAALEADSAALEAELAALEDEIAAGKTEAVGRPPDRCLALLEELIECDQQEIDEISAFYPSEATRRVPGFDIDEWRAWRKRLLEFGEEVRRAAHERKKPEAR